MKKLLISLFILCLMAFSAKAAEEFQVYSEDNNGIEAERVENVKARTFSKDEVISYKTYKISKIDKLCDKKNALVVYTPLFGKSTNTDTFGYEAVIVNNRVIKLNQYNSYIPKNGYVISGHGKAKKFITDNLFEGADVTIDFKTNEIKASIHPDNYLYAAIYRHDKIKALFDSIARDSMQTLIVAKGDDAIDTDNMAFFVKRSGEIIERTKKLIQFHDTENARKMAEDSLLYLDKALYYSLEFDPNELKGVYAFPYQKNTEEMMQVLDLAERLKLDNIFVESYFNGLTIYPSEVNNTYGLPKQNHYYKNFDILSAWLELAKDDNKQIYITLNTFNLGRPAKSSIKKSIVRVHRDWLLKTKKNEDYFLDPDNEEVQTYLLELIEEAAKKYDVAGINLKGINVKDKKEGIDTFVNKVIAFQEKNPNLKILINIYPDTDITKWNLNENIALLPVLTSSDDDFAYDFLKTTIRRANSAKIYPVYMEPYLEEKPARLFDQVATARKLNIKGIILYDIDFINKQYFDALKCSIFREPSKKKGNFLYEQGIKKEE